MSEKDFEQKKGNEDISAGNVAEDMPETGTTDEKSEEMTEHSDNTTEDELNRLKDVHLRLMAEYDNYRKRTLKEKVDLIKNGGETVLVGLLPIIDDFQRALETICKAKDLDAVKEGVNLIYQKFLSYLRQNEVKAIEAINQTFDPDLFEAVAAMPAQNDEQKGKVIDTIQTGYTLNDKVIRHAKVIVAN